jgi:hypothetical protein
VVTFYSHDHLFRYSIEKVCSINPIVPLSQRENRAYLLMKELVYVYEDRFAWNTSFFPSASHDLNMSFVGGWNINLKYYNWDPEDQEGVDDIEDREHGVINLGNINQTQFVQELGKSKVLVGVGNPWWSPSPYDALCRVWDNVLSCFGVLHN